MQSGMRAHQAVTPLPINHTGDGAPDGGQFTVAEDMHATLWCFFDIGNLPTAIPRLHSASVVWLATAGGITNGLIEDDPVAFAGMGNHGGGAFPQKRIVMVQQYGHKYILLTTFSCVYSIISAETSLYDDKYLEK